MKTTALFSAAILSVLTQWPLPFATDTADLTQPFTAAPHVATYTLTE